MGLMEFMKDPTKILDINIPFKKLFSDSLRLLGVDNEQIQRLNQSIETDLNVAGSLLSPITGVFLFSGFILEEALQASGFAFYMSSRANDFAAAKVALDSFIDILAITQNYYDEVLSSVPPVNLVMGAYLKAANGQRTAMEAVLAGRGKDDISGSAKVFDMRQ